MSSDPPRVLNYESSLSINTRSGGRPIDPVAIAAVFLGLMLCVPVLTGLMAIVGGVTIWRTADAWLSEKMAACLAIGLGALNLTFWLGMALGALSE